ncbi:hypothetical protein V6N12_037553 [Hibiscus sabdariffa]
MAQVDPPLDSSLDTTVNDDEISMIFSYCKSLWNFVATSTTTVAAISSVKTENNGANTGNETLSRSSSNQRINKVKHLETNSGSSKRGLNFGYFNLLHIDSSPTGGGFKLVPEN